MCLRRSRQGPYRERVPLRKRYSDGQRLQSGNYDLGRKKQRHQRKHSPRKGNGETVQNYKRELTNNFVHDIIYRKKNIILQYIKNEVQLCQTHQTLK